MRRVWDDARDSNDACMTHVWLIRNETLYHCINNMYRVAKTHRIPYPYRSFFCKSYLYLVALLWKMICNLGDPMCLRHPVHLIDTVIQRLISNQSYMSHTRIIWVTGIIPDTSHFEFVVNNSYMRHQIESWASSQTCLISNSSYMSHTWLVHEARWCMCSYRKIMYCMCKTFF